MNRLITLILSGLSIILCLWLLKYLVPPIAPFLPALAAAAAMEPLIRRLCRRGLSRPAAAGLMTALLLAVCIGVLSFCAAGSARLLTGYAKKAPALLTELTALSHRLRSGMEHFMAAMPHGVGDRLWELTDSMTQQLSQLPLWVSKQALDGVTDLAKASPDWLLFVCTCLIGTYFFALYFPDMGAFFRRQLSDRTLEKLRLIRHVLTRAAGGYLKVQCLLSGVTFLLLSAAFRLMGIPSSAPAAAAIAIIDALPILGAGAVLLPWALIALLLGRIPRGLGLLMLYGVVLVCRNALQAKLMGSQMGLHPITALVSLYAGWRLGGLGGMLLLPMVCVVLCSLNRAEVIKLYR